MTKTEGSARWSARELYVSPKDVLADPVASIEEKRALLASWASDARAVRDVPALRQLDSGALVFIDEVLEALKQLDHLARKTPTERNVFPAQRRDFRRRNLKFYRKPRRDSDDDDPSPAPAVARPPSPLPTLERGELIAA